jgi:phage-related protein
MAVCSFAGGVPRTIRTGPPASGGADQILASMSYLTYHPKVRNRDKPLAWLHGEIKTPPLSPAARIEAGYLLQRLQSGDRLGMPHSRPMPSIDRRCHELRINDADSTWRIVYRVDEDAIVILEVFSKKTQQTPKAVVDACKRRLKEYDGEKG